MLPKVGYSVRGHVSELRASRNEIPEKNSDDGPNKNTRIKHITSNQSRTRNSFVPKRLSNVHANYATIWMFYYAVLEQTRSYN